jgi:hypothetical protein
MSAEALLHHALLLTRLLEVVAEHVSELLDPAMVGAARRSCSACASMACASVR